MQKSIRYFLLVYFLLVCKTQVNVNISDYEIEANTRLIIICKMQVNIPKYKCADVNAAIRMFT